MILVPLFDLKFLKELLRLAQELQNRRRWIFDPDQIESDQNLVFFI
jgi:hypothetical protein